MWILYRNGLLFGYEDQVHNPVHFKEVEREEEDVLLLLSSSGGEEEGGRGDGAKRTKTFVAYVRASKTIQICCGKDHYAGF